MPRAINPKGIRKLNTVVTDNGKTITCKLYSTVIATYTKATHSVLLYTGGCYNTPTTIRRMNECLHHWGFTQSVSSKDFNLSDTLTIKESK